MSVIQNTTQRFRECAVLLLLSLLPFHAFLVTVGTRMMFGPDHAPWGVFAIWKEALLGVILLIALMEIIRTRSIKKIDLLDALILLLIALAVMLFLGGGGYASTGLVQAESSLREMKDFLLGVRYDLVPLAAFVILRRVSWSAWFLDLLPKILLAVGAIVSAYALATLVLPQEYFNALGYNDLYSIYLPGHAIAGFQQIEGIAVRRIQGTFSGANQLGLWLIIPWSMYCSRFAAGGMPASIFKKNYKTGSTRSACGNFIIGILILLTLLFTFSRAAWIGTAVAMLVIAAVSLPRSSFKKLFGSAVAAAIVLVAIILLVAPSILLRATSTSGHLEKPLEGIRAMIAHPLGLGLGSAGPASNRSSDSCVFLAPGADTAWALPHPDVCVFVGDQQIQPTDRACHCPFVTENWYVQIGVELGWIGFALFIALTLAIILRSAASRSSALQMATLSAFAGIATAALFLHAWEDSATAYSLWMLLAIILSK